jgi:hypothetical protein
MWLMGPRVLWSLMKSLQEATRGSEPATGLERV